MAPKPGDGTTVSAKGRFFTILKLTKDVEEKMRLGKKGVVLGLSLRTSVEVSDNFIEFKFNVKSYALYYCDINPPFNSAT